MTDQATRSEDDWAKQMLAEALLGPSKSAPLAPVVPDVDAVVDPPLPEPDAAPTLSAPVPISRPAVRFKVVLDEPVEIDFDPGADADPGAVADLESTPAIEPLVDSEPTPASTSRLFERPVFDATNDPDVDEMLADDRADIEVSAEHSRLRGAIEWVVVLGSAVIVALLLRAFLFQAFFIPSESMEATLRVDDRVLVNKLSYRFGDVERGEVVVFRRPDDQPGEFRDLIKRVIGLPGERIEARGNTIFIDGQVLIEPYLTPGEVVDDFGPVEIAEGQYFLMGDNRDNSGDSRVFGTVDGERFTGRAFFLFWPLDRIGSL